MAVTALEWALRLSSASAKLNRKIRKHVGTQAYSLTEQAILALLERSGPMLPSQIALEQHISAQAVSQILNRLGQAGCVDKSESTGDRRKLLVSLSADGKATLQAIRTERGQWLKDHIKATLTADEKKALPILVRTLERLTGS